MEKTWGITDIACSFCQRLHDLSIQVFKDGGLDGNIPIVMIGVVERKFEI